MGNANFDGGLVWSSIEFLRSSAVVLMSNCALAIRVEPYLIFFDNESDSSGASADFRLAFGFWGSSAYLVLFIVSNSINKFNKLTNSKRR